MSKASVPLIKRHPFVDLRDPCDYDIYLAGPFFNPEQVQTMDTALASLRSFGYSVFNPREHGPVIGAVPPAQRTSAMFDEILERNRAGVRRSFITLACIDDRDSGTMWELGFGHALGIQQLTFSGKGHGANVMISRSVLDHSSSLVQMNMKMAKTEMVAAIKHRLELPAFGGFAETEN